MLALAAAQRVTIERVDRKRARSRGARRACIRALSQMSMTRADYCGRRSVAEGPAAPLIVVLDGIEDPHNVGAILRTADAAGVSGIVRQSRHAAALDGVVGKASAGALAHVAHRNRRQHRARVDELTVGQRLGRRPRGRWSGSLHRGRLDAADGARARRRRDRVCGVWYASAATGS